MIGLRSGSTNLPNEIEADPRLVALQESPPGTS